MNDSAEPWADQGYLKMTTFSIPSRLGHVMATRCHAILLAPAFLKKMGIECSLWAISSTSEFPPLFHTSRINAVKIELLTCPSPWQLYLERRRKCVDVRPADVRRLLQRARRKHACVCRRDGDVPCTFTYRPRWEHDPSRCGPRLWKDCATALASVGLGGCHGGECINYRPAVALDIQRTHTTVRRFGRARQTKSITSA
jgi:hypothetical protein